MTNQRSSFSGFLDGYKAQNLENVSEQASIVLVQIEKDIAVLLNNFSEAKTTSLLREIKTLRFSTSSLITFGEIIKMVIVNEKAEPSGILDSKEFKLAIYHFLDVARMINDNNVINIALDVANSLPN